MPLPLPPPPPLLLLMEAALLPSASLPRLSSSSRSKTASTALGETSVSRSLSIAQRPATSVVSTAQTHTQAHTPDNNKYPQAHGLSHYLAISRGRRYHDRQVLCVRMQTTLARSLARRTLLDTQRLLHDSRQRVQREAIAAIFGIVRATSCLARCCGRCGGSRRALRVIVRECRRRRGPRLRGNG